MQVPTELAIASLGNISFANFWFVAETSITKTMDLGSLYSEVVKGIIRSVIYRIDTLQNDWLRMEH